MLSISRVVDGVGEFSSLEWVWKRAMEAYA